MRPQPYTSSRARLKSSIETDGIDRDAVYNDEAVLLALDDVMAEGKNLQLDDTRDFDRLDQSQMLITPAELLGGQDTLKTDSADAWTDFKVRQTDACLLTTPPLPTLAAGQPIPAY
jgi:hypothetical protein